ncbi:hypothetical protein SAMN05444156_2154 [Verrucomicrobium sp. GAS474]|uniref:hypothetical protein n=1 Tax=Verrucomicrobium sp. GAS474 TaxID=1882831 RepID=UPI00087C8CF3|nr:hypothetical protein [Verrucomicrobium sp. GAS474]SDU13301.1 hypothetical protein SAMN05444156_2154 [Verrucomicrobium sp. GAS474]
MSEEGQSHANEREIARITRTPAEKAKENNTTAWWEERKEKLEKEGKEKELVRHTDLIGMADRLAASNGTGRKVELEKLTQPAREKETKMAEQAFHDKAKALAGWHGTTQEFEEDLLRAQESGNEKEVAQLKERLGHAVALASEEGKSVAFELRREELTWKLDRSLAHASLDYDGAGGKGPVSSLHLRDAKTYEAFVALADHVRASPVDRDRLQIASLDAITQKVPLTEALAKVGGMTPAIVEKEAEALRKENVLPPLPTLEREKERAELSPASQSPTKAQQVSTPAAVVPDQQQGQQEQARAFAQQQADGFIREQGERQAFEQAQSQSRLANQLASIQQIECLRRHDAIMADYREQKLEREREAGEHSYGIVSGGRMSALDVAAANDLSELMERSMGRGESRSHDRPEAERAMGGLAATRIMTDLRTSAHAEDLGIVTPTPAQEPPPPEHEHGYSRGR